MNPASDRKLLSSLFFRLLPIQILLAVVGAVNGIVSSLFAGNFINSAALSVVGLFSPVTMLLSAVSTMLVGGSQLLCGRSIGENQIERTRSVFSTDLTVSAAISLFSVLVLCVGAVTNLSRVICTEEALLPGFNQYILGQAVGIFPMILGQQLSAFLSLENRGKRTTFASIIFIIANFVFNLVFVYLLKMQTFGLALASSLGYWVFFGVQLQFYFSGKSMMRFSLRSSDRRNLLGILKIGYPGALTNGYQTLRGIIVNALLLQYVGSIGIASFAASGSVLGIFWAVCGGMTTVCRILIGISIGEEDRRSVTDTLRIAFTRGMLVQIAVSAFIILMAEPFTRLFYRDPADPAYQMTVNAFRILPLCMPLSILSSHFTCYAQAAGKQVLVHLLSVLDGVVCVAGFSAILVPVLGMDGVYWANVLNGLVCALAVLLYSIAARRSFPRNMEQLIVLPDSFGVPDDARLDLSVRSMAEVETISEQVIAFCRRRGIDERRAYIAGLSLEEMAGNVVRHGFPKDRHSHSVDIRVVHKEGDIILRIRDNCVRFNPTEQHQLAYPDDRIKSLGIRLVYDEARSISYQNVLGLNVLLIRI